MNKIPTNPIKRSKVRRIVKENLVPNKPFTSDKTKQNMKKIYRLSSVEVKNDTPKSSRVMKNDFNKGKSKLLGLSTVSMSSGKKIIKFNRHLSNSNHDFNGAIRKIVISRKMRKKRIKDDTRIDKVKPLSVFLGNLDILPQTSAFVHVLSAFISTNIDEPLGYQMNTLNTLKAYSMTLEDVEEESDSTYENSFAKPAVSIILKNAHKAIASFAYNRSKKDDANFEKAIENLGRDVRFRKNNSIINIIQVEDGCKDIIQSNITSRKKELAASRLPQMVCEEDEQNTIANTVQNTQMEQKSALPLEAIDESIEIIKSDDQLPLENINKSIQNSLHVKLTIQSTFSRNNEINTNCPSVENLNELHMKQSGKSEENNGLLRVPNNPVNKCDENTNISGGYNLITIFLNKFLDKDTRQANSNRRFEGCLKKLRQKALLNNFRRDVVNFLSEPVRECRPKAQTFEEPEKLILPSVKLKVPSLSQIVADFEKTTIQLINQYLADEQLLRRTANLSEDYDFKKELILLYKKESSQSVKSD